MHIDMAADYYGFELKVHEVKADFNSRQRHFPGDNQNQSGQRYRRF